MNVPGPVSANELISFLTEAGRSRRGFRSAGSTNNSFETTETTFAKSFGEVNSFFGSLMAEETPSKPR